MHTDLTTEERYSPEIAESRYRENLAAKGGDLKIGNDHDLAAYIERKIGTEGYSPAAVVGGIQRRQLTFRTQISEKTIYKLHRQGYILHNQPRQPAGGRQAKAEIRQAAKEESSPHIGR